MSQTFARYRVRSTTQPGNGAGLPYVFATGYPGYVTLAYLQSLTAEELGFYIDADLMQNRGPERHTEEFVLQASAGRRKPWSVIKTIVPLQGKDPQDQLEEPIDDCYQDGEYAPDFHPTDY